MQQAREFLAQIEGKTLLQEERIEKTLELAKLLIVASQEEATKKERMRNEMIGRMMRDPSGRAFLTTMTDQCFRSHSNKRTADQLTYLIKRFGIPHFFSESDRFKFLLFNFLGKTLPALFIPRIKKEIRGEFSTVLLTEDPGKQAAYFSKCKREHVQINLNHIGEAILGEGEAKRRLELYLRDLSNPAITYISIKISTLYSQVNMIGWDGTLDILAKRLRLLYRAAGGKFVNLDMEEYKDLDLTIALFKKVLSEPEFHSLQAGIVLQSYLPDSFEHLQALTQWALERVSRGGAPIKIRLVKGANLAMERIESSLRGWNLAPFSHKEETDANMKKMLEYALDPKHVQAVHIGLGSHNLFDIAYCFVLRAQMQVQREVSFEMLEGMAEPMRRAVQKLAGSILLYCPEAKEKNFQNAIAYLIRRLDENGEEENFLRHFFDMKPENSSWKEQAGRFIDSVKRAPLLNTKRNRVAKPPSPDPSAPFQNEPDTDFSLQENRDWARTLFNPKTYDPPPIDDIKRIDQMLLEAGRASWRDFSFERRNAILAQAASVFRERRGVLLSVMLANTEKIIAESDLEVSESIDFIEYYRKNWERILSLQGVNWRPKGTILVAPPWNFPCSIPTGGIAAALTAGNAVIFKPAPESLLVGRELIQSFWDAGVPKDSLHFLNCADEPEGSYLIRHPHLTSVILTGGTETARHFMKLRPGLDLHAETGGKNALIITAMSDRDLAIYDLIHSAFGHAGQKCSACSLAILEAELYEDPQFLRQLKEGAESLVVGSAWNPQAKIPPLIRPPSEVLLKGLTELEPGESWLLEPKKDPHNPKLWSPGIKLGVKAGSFMHQTELFGPVLGVMRAETLDEAIHFANGTPYGLTSGIHTLDDREQTYWKERIVAGNLYINRGITGAIVRRQPFGGCKASSFGSGAKAGGPNYVSQFAIASERDLPHEKAPLPPSLLSLIASLPRYKLSSEEQKIWKKSAENYAYWAPLLKEPIDPSPVLGQDNYFYHVPRDKMYLCVNKDDPSLPLLQVIAACCICETPFEIFSDEYLIKRLRSGDRVRLLSPPSETLSNAAAQKGAILITAPILAHGRIELLHYLREVSLSINYHRYGYL